MVNEAPIVVNMESAQKDVVQGILQWNNGTQAQVIRILFKSLAKNATDMEVREVFNRLGRELNTYLKFGDWGAQNAASPAFKLEQLQLNEEAESDANN